MSRLALAWSGHEEIMLVWLQFCFPIESTISSGFPVISNNDLSLLAKLENFFQPSYGLANRWGDSCLGMKCFITGVGGRPSLEAPLVTGAKLLKAPQQWRLIILSALTFIVKLSRARSLFAATLLTRCLMDLGLRSLLQSARCFCTEDRTGSFPFL